jgi:hypothetical protein
MPSSHDEVAEREPPLEESLLLVCVVVLAGLRVVVAMYDGVPFDGQATISLFLVVGAVWCSARRAWRSARRWCRRSGALHDRARRR